VDSLEWNATVSRSDYEKALHEIKARIAAGITYQVNYTYRLRAPFRGDPWRYFQGLAGTARSGYPSYLDVGRWAVCSASPELFFRLDGDEVESRPMKGTAARGMMLKEDDERARTLQASEKDRAENLMIVDMIRNDLGRVAETGSVAVPRLCTVERFPTVLQMTSTVTARVTRSFSDLLAALFPCASVTGAPKVSTMRIIAELESTPRGLYTGGIGFLAPAGSGIRAQFSVAIRTVTVDRQAGVAEYGVGGGVLWDSDPGEEYRECEIKTRILSRGSPAFELLEAILWSPGDGYFLLDRHLARLGDSAAYFDVPVNLGSTRKALDAFAADLPPQDHKVRIAVDRSGAAGITAQALSATARPRVQRICLAASPVSSADVYLFHKTSRRAALERELAGHPGCDDVILWNERGEVTESCTANVVVERGGVKFTPPVACGLLPGTFRAELLDSGSITERIITRDMLRAAEGIWLINSIRKWMPAVFAHE
jgi:para-aminobenzoate synthetase/4-amino-4-deoxychorismate lyase